MANNDILVNNNTTTFTNDLTSQQHRLKNYLNKVGDVGATKEELVMIFHNAYPRHLENCKEENSTAFRNLRKDFQAIQESEVSMGIYACVKGYYKRLNEEEMKHYVEQQWKSLIGRIRRVRKMTEKANLDGQYRLVFKSEKEIFETFK